MAILCFETTSRPYFQIPDVKRPVCELIFYHLEPLSTFASLDISHSYWVEAG
jgi:hypothetical protein